MSSTNPYLPPAFTFVPDRAPNLYRVFAARVFTLVALVFGLVVVCYAIVLGFELSTPGANVLPSAWFQINVVGISGVCGLIAAIMAARYYRRGKNRLLRILLVFFVLAAIANISVAVCTVYRLGQEQTKLTKLR
jgi:cbb3-type cytochrome oxidase subunit 1